MHPGVRLRPVPESIECAEVRDWTDQAKSVGSDHAIRKGILQERPSCRVSDHDCLLAIFELRADMVDHSRQITCEIAECRLVNHCQIRNRIASAMASCTVSIHASTVIVFVKISHPVEPDGGGPEAAMDEDEGRCFWVGLLRWTCEKFEFAVWGRYGAALDVRWERVLLRGR